MQDIQFIQLSDSLDLVGAQEVPGLLPRTLELTGTDFRTAVGVYINEFSSPSFVIVGVNKILAQVPEQAVSQPIRSISVVSSEFTATTRSQVRFMLGRNPRVARGLLAMMQTYLKILFTTPGMDAFFQSIGGAALQAVGKNVDSWQDSKLATDLTIAVSRAAEHMRDIQRKQTELSEDERLAAANLLDIRFEPATTALFARVELVAQSGARAITNVEL